MSPLWRRAPTAGQAVIGSVVLGDVVQVAGVTGDVNIDTERFAYRVAAVDNRPVPIETQRARSQPSRLLLARHQVVPFTGRVETLKDLAQWASTSDPMAVRLIHAAGGQGKSRLAAEMITRSAEHGWTVWQVMHSPAPLPASAVDLTSGALLAVIDYADRWPLSDLLAVLTRLRRLQETAAVVIRVLLLARSAGFWWPSLADRIEGDLNIPTDTVALGPLDDDRARLFAAAAAAFAERLGIAEVSWTVPPLDGPPFSQVLAIHMAALATVEARRHGDTAPTQPHAVSAYLLRREQAHWHQLHERDPFSTAPQVMHRAVYTATLTGAVGRPVAQQAIQRAGLATDAPSADRIIDDHHFCYPPADARTVLEPMHPDRLGEDLVALSTPGHGLTDLAGWNDDWTLTAAPRLLQTDSAGTPAWSPAAVTTLIETAMRWPHIGSDVLYPLIRRQPELFVQTGGATLNRLTSIPGIDPSVLEPIEAVMPTSRHVDLDSAAAALSTHLTPYRLARTSDPAEQARLHALHAARLFYGGQRQAALNAAENTVALYQALAAKRPDDHLPAFAEALTNLGMFLAETGQRERALTVAAQAVAEHRRLAAAAADADPSGLAKALDALGVFLSDMGQLEAAVTAAEEAHDLYRRLVEADPVAFRADLAMSTTNLGNLLAKVGRLEEARACAEEAVEVYRRLAADDQDAHLPDLALAVNNLGTFLSSLGFPEPALIATQEAVQTRRRLADANPGGHLPDLAMSLINLGTHLAEVDRHAEAVAPLEEALAISRRLVALEMEAHPDILAISLNNLSNILSALNQHTTALAHAEEAVHIRRRQARDHPAAHQSDLAVVLSNYAIRLSEANRHEEAFRAAKEAVTILRRLAAGNIDAHGVYFAGALTTLCEIQSLTGRLEDAAFSAQEAINVSRQLTQTSVDARRLPVLIRIGKQDQQPETIDPVPIPNSRIATAANNPAALHAIAIEAADTAQRDCRPTPIAVSGGPDGIEIYIEGAVGFAWVHLPDHSDAFAAWLIEHRHAHRDGDGDGVTMGAPTFDYEPAIAWANAFAAVLRAAGHNATVTHELD